MELHPHTFENAANVTALRFIPHTVVLPTISDVPAPSTSIFSHETEIGLIVGIAALALILISLAAYWYFLCRRRRLAREGKQPAARGDLENGAAADQASSENGAGPARRRYVLPPTPRRPRRTPWLEEREVAARGENRSMESLAAAIEAVMVDGARDKAVKVEAGTAGPLTSHPVASLCDAKPSA